MVSYEPSTRAQALALKLGGRHSNEEIKRITGMSAVAVNRIVDRAIERGLDLKNPVILDRHVANGSRSGRPSKRKQKQDSQSQSQNQIETEIAESQGEGS
ncbi:hypothetical protein EV127DRAFT_55572 [Xylaria flabelliformis]|nr:hypothetical protein EV127DRAFT_55572 [Xylaria flabelliformis]